MRVVVQFEESCRPAMARWRRSLSANPVDQAALSQVYLDELKKRLVEHGGYPPGSVTAVGTEPRRYWAQLAGNMWVGYAIETGGTFRRMRTIRVIECEPLPPSSAIPASPPA